MSNDHLASLHSSIVPCRAVFGRAQIRTVSWTHAVRGGIAGTVLVKLWVGLSTKGRGDGGVGGTEDRGVKE